MVVMSHVAPMNTGRFLNYVLLMLGRFVCEKDLFFDGNLQEAFYRLPVTNLQADALAIARGYTMEVLRLEPASTNMFCRYLESAAAAISDVLLRNTIAYPGTPLIDTTTLGLARSEAVQAAMDARCNGLLDFLETHFIRRPCSLRTTHETT
ncbi:unnamed protein product [Vitrella brassicaformis CCMP3155]|uniref:Uncharacterized protein n=1 Tax=Vitrella brassicaformis (strain CCMP3155) TaxID=1169540 RepID=A0A0G4GKV6_VITBC|nr:unnamed protein product [Vitrella brassicaformis CCMP3155]|eukprot:CEM30661.1 unnamed protein product [Vitrella brassicaformis CCMP3155]